MSYFPCYFQNYRKTRFQIFITLIPAHDRRVPDQSERGANEEECRTLAAPPRILPGTIQVQG